MRSESTSSSQVTITTDFERRYRQHAAGALSRLTPAILRAQAWNMVHWSLIASSGLFGLYQLGWSPLSLLLLLVAGHSGGVLAEALKWLLFRTEYRAAVDTENEDRLVWAMVMAYRKGEKRIFASALQQTDPGQSVMVDSYAMAAAIALLGLQLRALGLEPAALFEDRWWLLNAILAMLWPFLGLFDLQMARQSGAPIAHQQFQPGGRGMGLLLVVAMFLWLSDAAESVRTLMMVIFVVTILVAVLAGFGLKVMADQRRWLAANLPGANMPAPIKKAAAPSVPTASLRPSRSRPRRKK
ncbi:hypothetical protein C7S18_08915 [Ahniella affigens]|uniref:Uncharacterized protein n=1 Tax=Ahniella affigens TaxID=2021234 RepID=A0A2P1PR46_9GAMM|nr:hypothetical protein [Ahniella affigens]AVP97305.1 hypothetical protein C7S18_08915 [Ahniella affigens]